MKLIAIIALAISATMATTDDGRRVVLKDNGTWKEAKQKKADKNDFRKANWGATKAQVIAAEKSSGSPVTNNSEEVSWKVTLDGNDFQAGYMFTGGRLTRGGYVSLEGYQNKNHYITDYQGLRDLLTKKYGKPLQSNTVWSNKLFADEPSSHGMAFSLGHVASMAAWETPKTKISLLLSGKKYKVSLMLLYESKEMKGAVEKLDTKKKLDDL